MDDRTDKIALVTGGSRGIGQAISIRLARDGYHVTVTDIQDASRTIEKIRDIGGTGEFIEADVTDAVAMETAIANRRLDVLVNNAAYFSSLMRDQKSFEEITEDEWDTVMRVNVKGIFITCKAALPWFRDHAAIINMSSGSVLRGIPGFLHYVASKAAVIGMTRSLATELCDRGIRVNAVMPGLTETPATRQSSDDFDYVVSDQALQRRIQPEDIANTVAFLASSDADMMTGQILNVDGGRNYR